MGYNQKITKEIEDLTVSLICPSTKLCTKNTMYREDLGICREKV